MIGYYILEQDSSTFYNEKSIAKVEVSLGKKTFVCYFCALSNFICMLLYRTRDMMDMDRRS